MTRRRMVFLSMAMLSLLFGTALGSTDIRAALMGSSAPASHDAPGLPDVPGDDDEQVVARTDDDDPVEAVEQDADDEEDSTQTRTRGTEDADTAGTDDDADTAGTDTGDTGTDTGDTGTDTGTGEDRSGSNSGSH